jgi:hypothetical protein
MMILLTFKKNKTPPSLSSPVVKKKERQKRTRDASRALQQLLGMSAYPSCELGIGERRHVRYCAFDERESA